MKRSKTTDISDSFVSSNSVFKRQEKLNVVRVKRSALEGDSYSY